MKQNKLVNCYCVGTLLLTIIVSPLTGYSAEIIGRVSPKNMAAFGEVGVLVTLYRGTNTSSFVTSTVTGKNGLYKFTVNNGGNYLIVCDKVGKCLVADWQEIKVPSEANALVRVQPILAHDKTQLAQGPLVDSIVMRAAFEDSPSSAVDRDLANLNREAAIPREIWEQVKAEFERAPIDRRIKAAAYPEIGIAAMRTEMGTNQKLVILDANGSESYKMGHLSGAINYEEAKVAFTNYLPQDRNALIVTYCGQFGVKAKACAEELAKAGYTNTFRLRGGLPKWIESGGAIIGNANNK